MNDAGNIERSEELWKHVMSATYTAATETFGKKQGSSQNDGYALYAEKTGSTYTSQTSCLTQVQGLTKSPITRSSESVKGICSDGCPVMHQLVLARLMLLQSDCLRYRQYQGNVR